MTKRRLFANITIISLILLISVLIYGLPTLLRTQLLTLIQHSTGRNATLAEVQLNPLPLSLELKDFVLHEKTKQPFISFTHLKLQINLIQSIKQTALIIDNIQLDQPSINIIQQNNGDYNFSDLLKPSSNSAAIAFNINNIKLNKGNINYQSNATKETLNNIQLNAKNISSQRNEKTQLNLTFNLKSGGQFNWQTESFLNPFYSTGHITITDIKPQALLTLINPQHTFDLKNIKQLNTDYQLNYSENQLDLTTYNSQFELHDFNYNKSIKNNNFIYQGNIHLTNKNNDWSLNSEQSSITANNFDLSIDNTTFKFAKLTLKTDFEIQLSEKNHLFNFKKTNTAIEKFQLDIDNTFSLNSADLNQNSDYQLSFDKQTWKLTLNNNKITGKNNLFDFKHFKISLPELLTESNITILFANNTEVNAEHGKIICHDCELLKDKNQSLAKITTLTIQGINLDLNKTKLNIASIFADTGNIRSWLNEKGETNYQALFDNNNTNTAEAKNNNPWLVDIEQIELKNFAASFVDQSRAHPVAFAMNPIYLKLNHYSNKTGTVLPLELNTVLNAAGNIKLQGNIMLEPFSTQVKLNATALDLTPFHAYIEQFLNIEFIDGLLNTQGTINATSSSLNFTGNVHIKDLVTRDKKNHKNFITWKKLSLNDISADTKKNSYTAKMLILDHPYSKITIRKDKTTNFSNLLIKDNAQHKTEKTEQPYFKLESVKIIDASSDFTDRSILLPFYAQIKELNGGANHISSDKNTATKISLKGNAFDFSPVDIEGLINPYADSYDLNLNFIGLPMPLISPYMVEFAGYKVEKGKLTLKLKYKIANKQLDASNNILIDQFELGEKVENPKAVSLPLELAVALLKDGDGKITIDVPVTGHLDDPQFDLGAIFADALTNVLSKVITSPFNALSDLLNGEEEELSTIRFKAGKADLEPSEQKKLIELAKVLRERPELILDIKGTAFQKEDWQGLKQAALEDEFKAIKADEINAKEPNQKIRAEYIELSTADYRRLLTDQFIKKFPNLAKKSLFGKPELIGITGDFYQVAKEKLSDVIKIQPSRLKRLATQRSQKIASFLTQQCHVPNGQVFILDSALDPKRETQEIISFLTLKGH